MDQMRKMDMDAGKETTVRLEFDNIEVSTVIIMARSVTRVQLILMLIDDKQ